MTYILNKLKHYILIFLVLIYIVLEELIWDRIAYPIFRYLQSFHIYEKFLYYIENRASNLTVLVIFLLFFITATLFGLVSGPLMVYCVICGFITYSIKIILIIIPFSILERAKNKLFYYNWFKYIYNKTIYYKHKIQSSEIYIEIIDKYKKLKNHIIKLKNRLKITNYRSKTRLLFEIIYRKLKKYFKKDL